MRDKGQMEIMGLAIVVLLVSMSLIFAVFAVFFKEPKDFKGSFTQAQMASNMLNTFLKTKSADCSDLTMTELLQNCAQNPSGPSITCENGMNSCEYAEDTASTIFSKTLDEWKVNYEFRAYIASAGPVDDLVKLGEACKGSKKSKLFPIPSAAGTVMVKMDVC